MAAFIRICWLVTAVSVCSDSVPRLHGASGSPAQTYSASSACRVASPLDSLQILWIVVTGGILTQCNTKKNWMMDKFVKFMWLFQFFCYTSEHMHSPRDKIIACINTITTLGDEALLRAMTYLFLFLLLRLLLIFVRLFIRSNKQGL